jgi:hypothetical protein
MSGNWYSFVGGNPGDQAGLVTSTGDYNADGITDYLIGAEGAAGEDGRIYLVSGTDLAAADAADGTDDNVIDLANVAAQPDSLVFTAPFAGGQLGVGLSLVDADGDGFDDLWLGARSADVDPGPGVTRAGAGYLVDHHDLADWRAANPGTDTVDLSVVTSDRTTFDASWLMLGESGGDQAGNGFGAADIDGDGTTDLLIGAPGRSLPGLGGAGRQYILLGDEIADAASDGVIALGDVPGQYGYAVDGDYVTARIGGYPHILGDLTGTGADSVAVSTGAATGLTEPGTVIVFTGADLAGDSDGIVSIADLPGADGFAVTGDAPDDRLNILGGDAAIPDIDDDGLPELGLGATGAGSTGMAWLLMSGDFPVGGSHTIGSLTGAAGSGSYAFVGPPGAEAGFRIAAIGDITGGAGIEIAISDARSGTPGRVWIVSFDDLHAQGMTDGGTVDLADITADRAAFANSFVLEGADVDDRAGISLKPVAPESATGGYGRARVLVGAADPQGATDPGAVYLLTGEAIVASADSDGIVDLGNLLCFGPGTRIAVPGGARPVDAIRPGELVETRDASPQHRLLLAGRVVERMFGLAEVLAPVGQLTALPGIDRVDRDRPIAWTHLLLARHAILSAEGAPAESLLPGDRAAPALPPGIAAELAPARPILTNPRARALAARLARRARCGPAARRLAGASA